MPEPIRVRDDETLHEYSTYAVDENGKSYDGLTVLDEPAVDATGTLLPPKYPDPEPEQATAPEEPAGDLSPTVPPATDSEQTAPSDAPATEAPAVKPSTKAPRPTEPTTGPKATSKES